MGKATYEAIPALPATYAGIKFRSRLEARWAYYFDLLGIPWKYEPDGFALKAGNYLPDFKCFDFFVEVKPTPADLEEAIPKLSELSEASGCVVFCVVDDPSTDPQRSWAAGQESSAGRFSHYAFQSKGWEFPDLGDGYETELDQPFADRASRLQFNRGGIAEVDCDVLRARNEVIKRRREAIKSLPKLNHASPWELASNHDEFAAAYEKTVKPMDQRLRTLDKLVFPPLYHWSSR